MSLTRKWTLWTGGNVETRCILRANNAEKCKCKMQMTLPQTLLEKLTALPQIS